MKFRTAYDKDYSNLPKTTFSKVALDYGYKFENGERVFGVIGEHNCYAEIQRDKNNTDWEILKQYLFNTHDGSEVPGVYGDRSLEIKDLIEGAEFLENMQSKYDSLPEVVKERYPSLMDFVYGFSEKDFDLFKANPSVVAPIDNDSKGD